MNTKTLFDFVGYIKDLTLQNRLANDHQFVPCTCSGIGYLEDVLSSLRNERAFVCVSDVCEESITRHGGGWFKRRVFTVFLLSRYNVRDTEDYHTKMNLCRELFRQFHSRFIVDEHRLQSELTYMAVDEIRSRELGGQFLNGCTGLYFMVALDEPTDLQYNQDEWQ